LRKAHKLRVWQQRASGVSTQQQVCDVGEPLPTVLFDAGFVADWAHGQVSSRPVAKVPVKDCVADEQQEPFWVRLQEPIEPI
jgi:hypothetical protein